MKGNKFHINQLYATSTNIFMNMAMILAMHKRLLQSSHFKLSWSHLYASLISIHDGFNIYNN